MAILRFVEKAKNYLLDIFFPIKCFGCGLKDKVLCDNCVAKIPQTERETENGIIALFDYRDPLIKKIIWEFQKPRTLKIKKREDYIGFLK